MQRKKPAKPTYGVSLVSLYSWVHSNKDESMYQADVTPKRYTDKLDLFITTMQKPQVKHSLYYLTILGPYLVTVSLETSQSYSL